MENSKALAQPGFVHSCRKDSGKQAQMLAQEVPPCRATQGLYCPLNLVSHAHSEACGTPSAVLAAHWICPSLAGALLGKAKPQAARKTHPRKEHPQGSPLLSVGMKGTG